MKLDSRLMGPAKFARIENYRARTPPTISLCTRLQRKTPKQAILARGQGEIWRDAKDHLPGAVPTTDTGNVWHYRNYLEMIWPVLKS